MQSRTIRKNPTSIFWMLTLCLFALASCNVTKSTKAVAESTAYRKVATEKFGDKVKFAFNENRNYVLCQGEPSSDPNDQRFGFLVYDMKAEKVIMEKSVRSGYVQWLSVTEIEIFTTPGTMRNDQSRDEFTQVFNVITGNSMPKTEWGK